MIKFNVPHINRSNTGFYFGSYYVANVNHHDFYSEALSPELNARCEIALAYRTLHPFSEFNSWRKLFLV